MPALAPPVQTCYGRPMTQTTPQNPGIQRAIQRAGSQTALARHLTAGQSTVNDWLYQRNPVPISVALTLEETLGIPRQEFRADLATPPPTGLTTYPKIEMVGRD